MDPRVALIAYETLNHVLTDPKYWRRQGFRDLGSKAPTSSLTFGRPLQVTVRPVLRDRCPVCLSVCNVGVLWPSGWMDQDATWYGGRPRSRRHCVRWRPSSPRRGAQQPLPHFSTHFALARSPISATAELLFKEIHHTTVAIWLNGSALVSINAALSSNNLRQVVYTYVPQQVAVV